MIFSKYEFFLRFIPCKKIKSISLIEREKIITKAEKKVADYLDVFNYTKLFENFEKLKYILLNNNQVLCFDYIKNRKPSDIFKENYNEKIFETIQYFKDKFKEHNFDIYDIKLLENCNNEFKELLTTDNLK